MHSIPMLIFPRPTWSCGPTRFDWSSRYVGMPDIVSEWLFILTGCDRLKQDMECCSTLIVYSQKGMLTLRYDLSPRKYCYSNVYLSLCTLIEHTNLIFLGRDGFQERPASFYAELQRLFATDNKDSTLRPWSLSDSWNAPDALTSFSEELGIFTVPERGLYHFFLTISVSRARVKPAYWLLLLYCGLCSLWISFSRLPSIWLETVSVSIPFGWNQSSESIIKPPPGAGLPGRWILSYTVK